MMPHVFVAESNEHVRGAFAKLLKFRDYRVTTAGARDRALEKLADCEQPDLLLLDTRLSPSGAESFREQQLDKELHPSVPVILLTSGDDRDARELVAQLDAEQSVEKPIGPENFVTIVEDHIAVTP